MLDGPQVAEVDPSPIEAFRFKLAKNKQRWTEFEESATSGRGKAAPGASVKKSSTPANTSLETMSISSTSDEEDRSSDPSPTPQKRTKKKKKSRKGDAKVIEQEDRGRAKKRPADRPRKTRAPSARLSAATSSSDEEKRETAKVNEQEDRGQAKKRAADRPRKTPASSARLSAGTSSSDEEKRDRMIVEARGDPTERKVSRPSKPPTSKRAKKETNVASIVAAPPRPPVAAPPPPPRKLEEIVNSAHLPKARAQFLVRELLPRLSGSDEQKRDITQKLTSELLVTKEITERMRGAVNWADKVKAQEDKIHHKVKLLNDNLARVATIMEGLRKTASKINDMYDRFEEDRQNLEDVLTNSNEDCEFKCSCCLLGRRIKNPRGRPAGGAAGGV